MAMRYIFRRSEPESFSDLKSQVPNLDNQLGPPAENLRRLVRVTFHQQRYAQYTFLTRKTPGGWIWICSSVELVAENEKGLFALTELFKIARPSHLAHLPA